ncbi:MAG: hypothetical protein U1D70_03280 [Methylobacter sp.]|nr:hypothetical protein [Methylobacter sp.]MDZ4218028.1 hypothetical protein [Methylobacter sp.]
MIHITMEGAEELQRKLAAINSPITRKRIFAKIGHDRTHEQQKTRDRANRPGRPGLCSAEETEAAKNGKNAIRPS